MELAAAFGKRGLVWYLPSHRKGLRRFRISLSPFSISTPRRSGSRCDAWQPSHVVPASRGSTPETCQQTSREKARPWLGWAEVSQG